MLQPYPEAETCFRRAMTVARSQDARALELRASISLSHFWRQQGKQEAAQRVLAEVYGWFTEGFDTADVRQAHALLAEWDG